MSDTDTIRALIARLEAGETGREIDETLWLMFPGNTIRVHQMIHPKGDYEVRATRNETGYLVTVPSYTTSVDAAIAFAEAALPGTRIAMAVGGSFSTAWIVRGWGIRAQWLSPTEESGNDEDLPRLIILATLKAKLAEVEV